MWGPGEYLLVTDKRKDREKRLGLCLFAFTLAGKFLNPITVAVATPVSNPSSLFLSLGFQCWTEDLVILQESSRPLAQTGIAKEPSHTD